MRLLHVHDFFARGNSRYGHDICRHLAGRGHEVHVLAATLPGDIPDNALIDGVRFHTYEYAAHLGAFGQFRRAMKMNRDIFERLHSQYRFDTVLFNQPLCAFAVNRSPLARETARKYAFLAPWGDEWIAHRGGGGQSFLRKVWEIPNVRIRNRIEESVLQNVSSIMVISEYSKSLLLSRHPTVRPDAIRTINCGVDPKTFAPTGDRAETRKRWGVPSDAFLLLTVRRLVKRMGIDRLIKAVPAILSALPSAYLIVGGEGPMKEDLQSIARESGYGERIVFVGYVKDEDLPSLYSAADLFVLPTVELEGFGLVIIEAMACGTAVMGTPVGAIPEVLGRFDRQLLFGGTAPEDIASGIISASRSGLIDRSRPRCRPFAISEFGWDGIIPKIENFLLS